jgi:TonB family protein
MTARIRRRVFQLLLSLSVPIYMTGQTGPILNENINVLYFKPLDYPLVARLKRIQGTVVVRAKITPRGDVAIAQAISGPKELLSEAIENARKWHFRPNKEMIVIIVYHFRRLEGLCELPCPSQFIFEPPNVATVTIGEPIVSHGAR